jgi:hypothetical protein
MKRKSLHSIAAVTVIAGLALLLLYQGSNVNYEQHDEIVLTAELRSWISAGAPKGHDLAKTLGSHLISVLLNGRAGIGGDTGLKDCEGLRGGVVSDQAV